MAASNNCATEPWGRYSASGGVYPVNGVNYLYSFGGDTQSDADNRGGVVRTNFRLTVDDDAAQCWERLNDSPVEIGYRATATRVEGDPDHVYVLFGSDGSRAATNQFYRYSLGGDTWTLLNVHETNDDVVPPPRWKHAAVALDETRILVTGGRDGGTVRADAWIFDTADSSWTLLDIDQRKKQVQPRINSEGTLTFDETIATRGALFDEGLLRAETISLPPMYRHGLAFDPSRNVAWIYGGLDGSFSRHLSQLWRLDMSTNTVTEVSVDKSANPPPPRLASHSMEYVAKADAVLVWGGTCGDDSELHIYDPQDNTWCRVFNANRPDRRDAMLWSLQFPNFYIAGGDSICYNGQVLTLMDVHVLNLQDMGNDGRGWEMLYEPSNVPRGTGMEPFCDGSNAGNCRPRPLLKDTSSSASTCSRDLIARFFNATANNDDQGNAIDPGSTDGSSTISPMASSTNMLKPSSSPTQLDASGNHTGASDQKQSGAFTSSPPGLALAWLLLWVVK